MKTVLAVAALVGAIALLVWASPGIAQSVPGNGAMSIPASATLTTPTITSPTITGTIAGGASITAPTLTSPTITGTGTIAAASATLSGAVSAGSLTVASGAVTPVLTGTTGSIGGGALGAGACASGTVNVTGATTAMSASVSPSSGTDPTNGGLLGVALSGRVSSAGVVTVSVCVPIIGTPTAATYNVRVFQ